MQLILTNLDPIHIEDLPNGEIELQELKIWPGWTHPKFLNILTYQIGGNDYALQVTIGKRYTFDVLAQDISDALNLDGELNLYHNNDRVTWRVFPPPKPTNPKISGGIMAFLRPHNIQLSTEIAKLLKLDKSQLSKDGIMTGEPVDKASVSFCFSDASTLFFTCDECDMTTLVNNQLTKAFTAMPVAAAIDGSLTASLNQPAILTFSDNYKNRLTFRIQDELGNTVKPQRVFSRLKINDKRLYRRQAVP